MLQKHKTSVQNATTATDKEAGKTEAGLSAADRPGEQMEDDLAETGTAREVATHGAVLQNRSTWQKAQP